jgi:hypothetical protein
MENLEAFENLSRRERKEMLRELKKHEERKVALMTKMKNWLTGLVIAAVVVVGVLWWNANRRILPPTDIAGHVEQNPPSHILDKPMPLAIQKHMLEHADGKGKPGVVINYNCEDFECEENLKEKLAEIANRYPEFVYVAPYPRMSVKLAITRMGKIEVFDKLDEEALIRFIED